MFAYNAQQFDPQHISLFYFDMIFQAFLSFIF